MKEKQKENPAQESGTFGGLVKNITEAQSYFLTGHLLPNEMF